MKKQMKRTVYEAPVTERFQVELEGTFCASVDIENTKGKSGEIEAHEVNGSFGSGEGNFSDDFSAQGWQ